MFHTMTKADIAKRSIDEDTLILAMQATGYLLFHAGYVVVTSKTEDGCRRVADFLQYHYNPVKELPLLDMSACPITEE